MLSVLFLFRVLSGIFIFVLYIKALQFMHICRRIASLQYTVKGLQIFETKLEQQKTNTISIYVTSGIKVYTNGVRLINLNIRARQTPLMKYKYKDVFREVKYIIQKNNTRNAKQQYFNS